MLRQNEQSLSMPNLPGMFPDRSSWVYREKNGFRKSSSRPSTATSTRNTGFKLDYPEVDQYLNTNQQYNDIKFTNINTLTNSKSNFNTLERPKTANNIGYRGATPLNFTGTDFEPITSHDTGFQSRPNTGVIPDYVKNDKKVLRYYGHFFQKRTWDTESPLGSPELESEMARLLVIQYYLVDNTVEISEPKMENTGAPSGTFFKKAVLKKTNGEELQLLDLLPRNTVYFLGQEIFITDADPFTRKYYQEELGITMAGALPRPKKIRKDIGAQYATGLGGAKLPKMKDHYGTCSTDYSNTKAILDKTKLFYSSEGKVLRFQCCEVTSSEPPFFPDLQMQAIKKGYNGLVAAISAKKFALSYYLSSCNIDLLLQKMPMKTTKTSFKDKSSTDEPKLILKKSKLPTNWREAQRGLPPKYFTTIDFKCGKVIDIYGRYFLLLNCDSFTMNFYQDMGLEQNEVHLMEEEQTKILQPIPQLGDGFLAIGSNEDSLGTVYGMPKPGKDLDKLQRNQGRLIRCKASLISVNEIDSSREFMITLFLEDDTIAVFEEVKRNSGIWGGNFLKRGRYMNDLPGEDNLPRYIVPGDIYLGNVISFNGNEFQIIEMDSMSLQFCENYPDEFPMMDTFKIIGTLMQKVKEMKLDLRPTLRQKDPLQKGWIDQATFILILDNFQLIDHLNDQEILTLLRRFKDSTNNHYIYDELCDFISHVFGKNKSINDPKYKINNTINNTDTSREKTIIDTTNFDKFLDSARIRTIQWRRSFRKEPNTLNGYVTLAILIELFTKHGLDLSYDIITKIKSNYMAEPIEADNILKKLKTLKATESMFQGLDLKVKPKEKHANIDLKNSSMNDALQKNGQDAYDRIRKKSIFGSTLRSSVNQASSTSIEYDETQKPANIIINYIRLCDDIYICDWM